MAEPRSDSRRARPWVVGAGLVGLAAAAGGGAFIIEVWHQRRRAETHSVLARERNLNAAISKYCLSQPTDLDENGFVRLRDCYPRMEDLVAGGLVPASETAGCMLLQTERGGSVPRCGLER